MLDGAEATARLRELLGFIFEKNIDGGGPDNKMSSLLWCTPLNVFAPSAPRAACQKRGRHKTFFLPSDRGERGLEKEICVAD